MSLFSELRGVILSVGQDFRSVYVIVVSVEGSTEYYLVGVDYCLHVENCILCIYLYSNRLNNTTCFCTLYKSAGVCNDKNTEAYRSNQKINSCGPDLGGFMGRK